MAGDAGQPGLTNGLLPTARFNAPEGLALRGRKLLVADTGNDRVRIIDLPTAQVDTLEGDLQGAWAAGAPLRAPFRHPSRIASGPDQMVYLVPGFLARFDDPSELGVNADGNAYVLEPEAGRVRRIEPGPVSKVSTVIAPERRLRCLAVSPMQAGVFFVGMAAGGRSVDILRVALDRDGQASAATVAQVEGLLALAADSQGLVHALTRGEDGNVLRAYAAGSDPGALWTEANAPLDWHGAPDSKEPAPGRPGTHAMAVDRHGRLHLVEAASRQIWRREPGSRMILPVDERGASSATPGEGAGPAGSLPGPRGIVVTAGDEVVVPVAQAPVPPPGSGDSEPSGAPTWTIRKVPADQLVGREMPGGEGPCVPGDSIPSALPEPCPAPVIPDAPSLDPPSTGSAPSRPAPPRRPVILENRRDDLRNQIMEAIKKGVALRKVRRPEKPVAPPESKGPGKVNKDLTKAFTGATQALNPEVLEELRRKHAQMQQKTQDDNGADW